MAATKTVAQKRSSAKKTAATQKTTVRRTVAKKSAIDSKVATKTPKKDYTAVLVAAWVALILVFLVLVLYKMY